MIPGQPIRWHGPFVGGRILLPEGHFSGIAKQPVSGEVMLGCEGFSGDLQVDTRQHGGPERAVCVYPLAAYRHWTAIYPRRAADFVPGAFGENLCWEEIDEDEACVGDRWQLGDAILEISQPRTPCWKLSHTWNCRTSPNASCRPGAARAGCVASSSRDGWRRTQRSGWCNAILRVCPSPGCGNSRSARCPIRPPWHRQASWMSWRPPGETACRAASACSSSRTAKTAPERPAPRSSVPHQQDKQGHIIQIQIAHHRSIYRTIFLPFCHLSPPHGGLR